MSDLASMAKHAIQQEEETWWGMFDSSKVSAESQELVHVSTLLLLLSTAPLGGLALISWVLDLELASPIVVGTIRTFLQLTLLGLILQPIFILGEERWWLVILYTFLMVLLASYESAARSKYHFQGMFPCVLASLLINVTLVSLFTFLIIIRPTPVWDPQYVIPIVGMLLGNCINGIALSLNAAISALVEQNREVELYLSFGATAFEASSRLMREAVRTGAVPMLNTLSVIGIISIPGKSELRSYMLVDVVKMRYLTSSSCILSPSLITFLQV